MITALCRRKADESRDCFSSSLPLTVNLDRAPIFGHDRLSLAGSEGERVSLSHSLWLSPLALPLVAAGTLAGRIGAPRNTLAGAVVCIATGIRFSIRRPMMARHVRPIYVERGILPPIEETELPAA